MRNILSLILGFSAWVLGFRALAGPDTGKLSSRSFFFCTLSLLVQFFEIRSRVAAEDLAGLMDTVPALTMAASVLVVVTVILNLLARIREK